MKRESLTGRRGEPKTPYLQGVELTQVQPHGSAIMRAEENKLKKNILAAKSISLARPVNWC